MGYGMGEINHEDMNMVQTPENVKAVRLRAGWTQQEAGDACCMSAQHIDAVESGSSQFSPGVWKTFLHICGSRVFDAS